MKRNLNLVLKNKIWYLANAVLACLFLAPLFWALSTSLKPASDMIALPPKWIPTTVTFEHYKDIWKIGQHIFVTYFSNSLLLTAATVVANVVISTLAAYGLSKLQVPFKKLLLVLILSTIMVPFQSLLIPLHGIMRNLGLLNTHAALVIIYVTFHLPVAVYIMINTFDTIPDSLRESAQIDGAKEFAIFGRIMLPVVWPGLTTVAIYSAYTTWNDYIVALVFTSNDQMRTLNIGLTNMALGIYGTDWGILSAGVVISFIPMVVLFAFLQRFFISGLTSGSVKS